MINEEDYENPNGPYHKFVVSSISEELPIQGVYFCGKLVDSDGSSHVEIVNLANRTVYGFNPNNGDSSVYFADYIEIENGEAVATFGAGDTILINTTSFEFLSLIYHAPNYDSGGLLYFTSGAEYCFDYDWDSDGASGSDAFPFDPSEQLDSDMDGVGDNADAFPNDPTETLDTDGDGVGDNSDAYLTMPTGVVIQRTIQMMHYQALE